MNTINVNTKESQSQITEKWRKTGLLDELDESKADDCANSLEKTAQLLINDYDGCGWTKETGDTTKNDIDKLYDKEAGFFAGVALPIVRRLYSEDVQIPKIEWLYEDLKLFLRSKHQLYKDLTEYNIALDGEAEFCGMYVENLVSRLR
jgi:hypothetical protein